MKGNNLSLEALKSHLFETLEGVKNLSDKNASECEKVSIEQAKQIVDIADSIIDVYKVQLDGIKIAASMDNVASAGTILETAGIISPEERKMIGD